MKIGDYKRFDLSIIDLHLANCTEWVLFYANRMWAQNAQDGGRGRHVPLVGY
ncbi:MAG: hypothetical protein M3M88_02765 [Thermoproteota archaeon]|nr:hypothetical protein [Thermoproteota archaeon]